jgi:hypothetical protein
MIEIKSITKSVEDLPVPENPGIISGDSVPDYKYALSQ